MKRPAINLLTDLQNKFFALERTRVKMDSLFAKKKLLQRDIDLFYEGIFLSAVTCFEKFLENLFLELSCGNLQTTIPYSPIVTFRNKSIARQIITANKNYLDWIPYSHTIDRAKIFFKLGQPFTSLLAQNKAALNEIVVIRNCIAHKSDHSFEQFEKQVLGASLTRFLPRNRKPAPFLRSIKNTPQIYYQHYIIELATIAQLLTT